MLDSTDSLINKLKIIKIDIAPQYGIKKLGLFGSYAKGLQNEQSDIDLVIELENKDYFIREEIKEYIQTQLNKKVDLGYLESMRSFFKDKIKKDIIYV